MDLTAEFVAHLQRSLAGCLHEARLTYPHVTLSDEDFVDHVHSKLEQMGMGGGEGAAGDGTQMLARLHTTDLFLARASANRDVAAIAHLEQNTFGEIDAAYKRFPDIPVALDDVKQRVREKLLLSEPAGILGYAGTGALRGWMRASVLHMLLNIVQRETREEPTDAELFEVVIGAQPNAEAEYVKLACREELEAALAFAMSSLSDREKSLLRHAFVDRRSVDEIGAIYGVHRATAARWVAGARAQLVEHTRMDLTRRLGVSELEARSIIVAALSGVGSMLIAKLGRS